MVILIGPSGTGKSSIEKALEEKGFSRVISYTTREKRKGEVDGVNYHYIDEKTFKDFSKKGYFAETAYYNKHYYGAKKEDFVPFAVAVFETEGLAQVEDQGIKHFLVFIDSEKGALYDRMLKRGDTEVSARNRITLDESLFDPESIDPDLVITNGQTEDVEQAISQIAETIKKAYQCWIEKSQ